MKTLDDLKEGDYIAFGFSYNGGKPNEIIVDNITSIVHGKLVVHFLYGYKSMCEVIKKEDVLAIGDEHGKGEIKWWHGKYHILNQEEIEKITKRKKNT